MNYLVTGGAGFIGSHLVDRLLELGNVTVFDNLSSGRTDFIEHNMNKDNFKFIKADLLDKDAVLDTMKGIDFVFHIAANPDIRYGIEYTDVDLKQGTIATYNVLESMRLAGVKNIVFSSSSTIYGEPTEVPVPEDYGPSLPISLYGASKLAGEGLLTSFASTFDMQVWIFRFANIIGSRGTHGVIFDFIGKLKKNPEELEILGDGSQCKSYLLAQDCVDAMLFGIEHSKDQINVFNLGCDDWINVTRIAEILVEELPLENVKFSYTGGERGWAGDVPKIMLYPKKINTLGWKASTNSEGAIRSAVKSSIEDLW